jgi:hypothetical protein
MRTEFVLAVFDRIGPPPGHPAFGADAAEALGRILRTSDRHGLGAGVAVRGAPVAAAGRDVAVALVLSGVPAATPDGRVAAALTGALRAALAPGSAVGVVAVACRDPGRAAVGAAAEALRAALADLAASGAPVAALLADGLPAPLKDGALPAGAASARLRARIAGRVAGDGARPPSSVQADAVGVSAPGRAAGGSPRRPPT